MPASKRPRSGCRLRQVASRGVLQSTPVANHHTIFCLRARSRSSIPRSLTRWHLDPASSCCGEKDRFLHRKKQAYPSPHHLTGFGGVSGGRVTSPGEGIAGAQLTTRPLFHLEATVRVLQRRPTNRIDVWEPNHYL